MFSTNLKTLENKVIIITGGTSGIGYEIVRLLAPKNTVMVIARASTRLDKLKSEFSSVEVFAADLSKPEQYENLAAQILHRVNTIDVLVNNAAVQYTPTFLDEHFSYHSIESEINLNFRSICALSYLLLPALQHDEPNIRESAIVNINSGLALAPKSSSAIYCATKAALDVFSQSLAYQLAHSNVKVMQAFLPIVDTPMTRGRGENKLSANLAAQAIVSGIEKGQLVNDVGKVALLRVLLRVAPSIAKKIMKRA
ncbi:SDR family oxidoreductase [Agaribacter flavus]|uniref:SDR family oxidoreductase n=1 Tax=Agaribacter flavus TaxID=1902781 RepID=A0ABV7FNF8_9ALTE